MAKWNLNVYSMATLSWIDPRTTISVFGKRIQIPKYDPHEPDRVLSFDDVTKGNICRFTNLLVAATLVEDLKIVDAWIMDESGLFVRASYQDTEPDQYVVSQYQTPPFDRRSSPPAWEVSFEQLVGCRTEAPEDLGGEVGAEGAFSVLHLVPGLSGDDVVNDSVAAGNFGRDVAGAIAGFPPIWTRIQIKMRGDGTFLGNVLAHSLFPSVTVYETNCRAADLAHPGERGTDFVCRSLLWTKSGGGYDGVPYYDEWKENGWGAPARSPEPGERGTRGNPWGI
jgi:hypothetical protein